MGTVGEKFWIWSGKVKEFNFLPRDSYAKSGICRRRVSVCVSVTPVLYQNG